MSFAARAKIHIAAARPMPVIINSRELLALEGSGIKYFSKALTSSLSAMNLRPVALLDRVQTSKGSTNNQLAATNIYQLHSESEGKRLAKIYEEAQWYVKSRPATLLRGTESRSIIPVSPRDPLYKIAFERFNGTPWADKKAKEQDIFEFPDFFYMDKLHISAIRHFKLTGQPMRLKIPRNICSNAIVEQLFYHNPYPYPIILDGAKNVLTIHDLIPLTHPELCLDNPDEFLRLITTLADESHSIHFISSYTSKIFTEILGDKYANKSHIVHQPLDFVPTPAQAEEIKCKSTKKFEKFSKSGEGYIVQIGTIEPKKNHLLSIEVIRQLRDRHPNLRLLVIGKRGWLCGSICDQLSSSKDIGIEWLGSLPRIVLKERLKNAWAFIFPSMVEGWGLPPLEAMAMGIPTVVSGIESCKEASQLAGIEIADMQNPTAYSAAILELLKSKELYLDHVARGLERSANFSKHSFQQQAMGMYA